MMLDERHAHVHRSLPVKLNKVLHTNVAEVVTDAPLSIVWSNDTNSCAPDEVNTAEASTVADGAWLVEYSVTDEVVEA